MQSPKVNLRVTLELNTDVFQAKEQTTKTVLYRVKVVELDEKICKSPQEQD